RLDAQGRVVIPGLIDSHVHMIGGGGSLNQIHLRDAKNKSDFIARLKKWGEEHPEQQWITGGRWSTESWDDKTEPTKHWLDEAIPDRPVYLSRMDGHSAVANSMALKLAGVTKDTEDPDGGRIVRDPQSGEPMGILRETAKGFVGRLVPGKSRSELVADLKAAMRHANSLGITSMSAITSTGSFAVYYQVADEGGQTVRFGMYPSLYSGSIASTKQNFNTVPYWLELKGVKVHMDGTLGSRTAYMREPFNNNPADGKDNVGLLMPQAKDGTIQRIARQCAENGLQVIGHAIGDMANHILIGFFKEAWDDVRAARPRLEHAQHLLAEDIHEIGRLGIITSYQPFHKADDGRYCEDYIGAERSNSSYAYKDVLDAGGVLAFGSDWSVVTLNPYLGIEAAVTGKTLAGKFWQTQNNITVMEALRGYTSSAAYAMFWEDRIGRIAPGFKADFVILNASPFGASPDWANMKPVATYVDGKKVFGD
ncbi:MAG: amidohydrolase, partial [Armatimonadetes bacterium]|nr:amidohydrolase [Armatimonadota bacterium]